jgi:uncharacterized tellurite resistance protein B-like protein
MNKDNQALLSDLIILAKADDKVTNSEYDFIMRIAQRMKVSSEEVDVLFKNPLPSKTSFTEIERITHFHKLVLLMNVDRETHSNEVHVIKDFGLKMGIRPGAIDQVLLEMEKHEDKIIPPQELIQIFQTYYN